jgi:hypothetical protein
MDGHISRGAAHQEIEPEDLFLIGCVLAQHFVRTG